MVVYLLQVLYNRSSEHYVFDHPNMARRALKNIALGIHISCYILVYSYMDDCSKIIFFFVAYLGCLEDQELTELAIEEYKTATNMTEQFAALVAIAQTPGKTRDDFLADFYGKWEHDFLVNISIVMTNFGIKFLFSPFVGYLLCVL